jgi:hypothetical protein
MFTVYVGPLEQPADSVYSLGQALCLLHAPPGCKACPGLPSWLSKPGPGRAGPEGCVAFSYKDFSAILGPIFFPVTKPLALKKKTF